MRRIASSGRRAGFTIVELLVAFALIIFMMAVLAQAFGAAGKVVSDLKVAMELEEKLRAVMTMLRRELAAGHFDTGLPGSQRKLSDATFWDDHLGAPGAATPPVPQGFLRIHQVGQPIFVTSGAEVPTTITSGSSLHYTVYRHPDTWGNMFRTAVPAGHALLTGGTDAERENRFQSLNPTNGDFCSPWGEVAWWLTPSGTSTLTEDGIPAQPLYTLRRRQRAIWPITGTTVDGVPNDLAEVSAPSAGAATVRLNDYTRLTPPALRSMMNAVTANEVNGVDPPIADARLAGQANYPTAVEDVVIADVLSFDVALLIEGSTDFRDLSHPDIQAYSSGNPAFGAGTGVYCFDTWTNQVVGSFDYSGARWSTPNTLTSVPLYVNAGGSRIRVRAIQITLRIWNQKGAGGAGTAPPGAARQMTIIQDL